MSKLEDKIKFLKKILKDKSWHHVAKHNDIMIEKKHIDGSDLICFRSYSTVNAKPEELYQYVWKILNDWDTIKIFEKSIISHRVVEHYDDNTRLCHQTNKVPWPLTDRELVYMQHCVTIDEIPHIIMYSTDIEEIEYDEDRYVRAHIHILSYIFEPHDDGCMIYLVAHLDPAGSIPHSIINAYSSKTTSLIRFLKKKYDKN